MTKPALLPAALVPAFDGDLAQINSPKWAPAGNSIAFLRATYGGGGFLQTAAADIGVVTGPTAPLFADFGYAWSPDGKRIAWTGGRSDVSPVDVNIYTVGDVSEPVVKDANATSVGFAADGRSVIFANGEATGSSYAAIPFMLRAGGIYSVTPPEAPVPLLSAALPFADVQPLGSGAVAFTEWSADQTHRTIGVVENGFRREVAQTPGDAPPPVWIDPNTLVYVGTAADRPLLIKKGAGEPARIDSGADSFGWGSRAGVD